MSWRFRKSISLGKGVRLNIGKKGLGVSAGVKGLRIGIGNKGAYTSAGIPGTGLYSVNYLGKHSKSSNTNTKNDEPTQKGCLIVTLGIIEFILIISLPLIGIPLLIIGISTYYFWSKQPKQKAKKKFTEARKFFNQQNYIESIKLLIEASQLDSTNNAVLRLLGGAYHNSKNFEEAIPYLKDFLITDSTDTDSQLILANCFYQTKKYKDAIDILQKMPKDLEQNLKVIQLLGACFAAEKKYDLAIDVFKKAPLLKRNLDDGLMEVHYNLALLYEEAGDRKNAIKHFKKVYAQNINYRDVSEKLGKLEI